MSYFPMFIDLKDKDCLIVGGGKIALHKVRVLLDFEAEVTVIADKIEETLWEMQQSCGRLHLLEQSFEEKQLDGRFLVVAATNDKECNHQISEKCKERKIPVNAVDQIEDCTFIFPSYLKEKNITAAFCSGGNSPVAAQYLKEQMRPVVTEFLGELTQYLGSVRPIVKEEISEERLRKKVYRKLLEKGLEEEQIPTDEYFKAVLKKYGKERCYG